MFWFHFSSSLNCRCTVPYGLFLLIPQSHGVYIMSTWEKGHIALPGLEFHSNFVNFDLRCKRQMEWGFEVSSAAEDWSTIWHDGQDTVPPRGSANTAGWFIYPCFALSSATFYLNKSIMLDSQSTAMITCNKFNLFCWSEEVLLHSSSILGHIEIKHKEIQWHGSERTSPEFVVNWKIQSNFDLSKLQYKFWLWSVSCQILMSSFWFCGSFWLYKDHSLLFIYIYNDERHFFQPDFLGFCSSK